MVRLSCVLILILMFLMPVSALAQEAGEEQPAQQVQMPVETRSLDANMPVKPIPPDTVAAKAGEMASGIWTLAQAYAVPLVLFALAAGAFMTVFGAIISRRLMSAGLTVVIAGLFAFLLINYAPEIVGVTQGLANSFFGSP